MIEVGQKLWFVSSHARHGAMSVTVEKIGHKWAKISGRMRIDKVTLIADGGQYSSPGRCWLSKEDHDAEISRQELWRHVFSRVTQYHATPGVTVEQIEAVADILGIGLPVGGAQ